MHKFQSAKVLKEHISNDGESENTIWNFIIVNK